MKKGYAILDCGTKFEVKAHHKYITYPSGALGYATVTKGENVTVYGHTIDLVGEHYVRVVFYTPEEIPLRFKKLVIPEGVTYLRLPAEMIIEEPLYIPKEMKLVRVPMETKISNLDELIGWGNVGLTFI